MAVDRAGDAMSGPSSVSDSQVHVKLHLKINFLLPCGTDVQKQTAHIIFQINSGAITLRLENRNILYTSMHALGQCTASVRLIHMSIIKKMEKPSLKHMFFEMYSFIFKLVTCLYHFQKVHPLKPLHGHPLFEHKYELEFMNVSAYRPKVSF